MFKKIEVWILYLIIIIGIIVVLGFGILVRQELEGSSKFGFLSRYALNLSRIPANIKWILSSKRTDPFKVPGKHSEKPVFNKFINIDRNELLLLSRYNADIGRSVVEIIDLNNFSVLHTYAPDIKEINSRTDKNRVEFERLKIDSPLKRYQLQHPLINKDGELIFHGSMTSQVKIDFCSNLIWVNDEDIFHHSVMQDHEGNYWVPTRMYPYSLEEGIVGEKHGNYNDDSITKISSNGEILFTKSVSEILIENGYKYLLFGQSNFIKDPIHLNDIEPALSDSAYWKKGDLFLSLRNLSMILHYRPSSNKLIKIITGDFYNQHDVDIISEKEISIFNNNTLQTINGRKILTNSEVLIFDFESEQFSKKFSDSMKKYDVKSPTGALADILEDGSMMVDEDEYGRLLFFNNSGDLEWEFINKAKNGNVYGLNWNRIIEDKELISNIKYKIQNTKCLE